MKRMLCTKVDSSNDNLYTLGKIYETDDNYLNTLTDSEIVICNTSLLTASASTFVEIPYVGDKILIKDGSKIKDYVYGWLDSMEKFVNRLLTFDSYGFSYSKDKTSIDKVYFYTRELERSYIFDSRAVTILGTPEKIDIKEISDSHRPLSFIKNGGLVVRRDGSKAIILDCKKGLYLAAKDLTRLRYLSEYEIDGTCRSYSDAYDIMEIYDLDDFICGFETNHRKLLWKIKSKQATEIEKEIVSYQKKNRRIKMEIRRGLNN